MNGAVVAPAPRLNTEQGKPAERRAGSGAATAAAATTGGGQACVRPQVKLAGGRGVGMAKGGGCRMGVGRVRVRRDQGLTSKPSMSLAPSSQIEAKRTVTVRTGELLLKLLPPLGRPQTTFQRLLDSAEPSPPSPVTRSQHYNHF